MLGTMVARIDGSKLRVGYPVSDRHADLNSIGSN